MPSSKTACREFESYCPCHGKAPAKAGAFFRGRVVIFSSRHAENAAGIFTWSCAAINHDKRKLSATPRVVSSLMRCPYFFVRASNLLLAPRRKCRRHFHRELRWGKPRQTKTRRNSTCREFRKDDLFAWQEKKAKFAPRRNVPQYVFAVSHVLNTPSCIYLPFVLPFSYRRQKPLVFTRKGGLL